MLKKLGLGLVALVVILLVVIATRPGTYHYERSATLAAPPDVAFGFVNDFHRWGDWSPWAKLDPAQRTSFDGAPQGVGAKYGWSGNDQVGEGRMEILESKANELVKLRLEFIRPFESSATTAFAFRAEGTGTVVTWGIDGTNSFGEKAMGLVLDMDKMLGDDFAKGLAQLKGLSEAEVARRAEEARKAAEAAAAAAAAEAAAAAAAPVEAPK